MDELREAVEDSGAPKYDAGHWSDELTASDKRMEKHLKQGSKVMERFLDHRSETSGNLGSNSIQFRLNLFHTNVSMMLAMLYGRVPKADVRRRWEDSNDDTARIGGEILRRILNADVEESGHDFTDTLRACLQDRLLPGQGIARIRYEFETKDEANPDYDPEGGDDEETNPQNVEVTDSEEAPVDYVHWRDFRWGFARRWRDVPWVAFAVDRKSVV